MKQSCWVKCIECGDLMYVEPGSLDYGGSGPYSCAKCGVEFYYQDPPGPWYWLKTEKHHATPEG